jgi:hypothetical protein
MSYFRIVIDYESRDPLPENENMTRFLEHAVLRAIGPHLPHGNARTRAFTRSDLDAVREAEEAASVEVDEIVHRTIKVRP